MRVELEYVCTLCAARSSESTGMIDATSIDRRTIAKRSKIAKTSDIAVEFVHPPTRVPVAALAD